MEQERKLVIVREFGVPLAEVWQAWADAALFGQWYGSPGKLEDVAVDFQPGGEWRATTVMPDGSAYPQRGEYTIIQEQEHIQFMFTDPDNPDDPDFETMNITFEPLGETHTRMTFTQSGHLPPDEYAGPLKEGWSGFFDKLQNLFQ